MEGRSLPGWHCHLGPHSPSFAPSPPQSTALGNTPQPPPPERPACTHTAACCFSEGPASLAGVTVRAPEQSGRDPCWTSEAAGEAGHAHGVWHLRGPRVAAPKAGRSVLIPPPARPQQASPALSSCCCEGRAPARETPCPGSSPCSQHQESVGAAAAQLPTTSGVWTPNRGLDPQWRSGAPPLGLNTRTLRPGPPSCTVAPLSGAGCGGKKSETGPPGKAALHAAPCPGHRPNQPSGGLPDRCPQWGSRPFACVVLPVAGGPTS